MMTWLKLLRIPLESIFGAAQAHRQDLLHDCETKQSLVSYNGKLLSKEFSNGK